jgi:hypothetical protein
MRRMLVGMLIAASWTAAAQGLNPAPSTPTVPSCAVKVKTAQSAGYKAGFDDGAKKAKAQCAQDASAPKWSPESFDAGYHANDTDLKAVEGKIPIAIIVEDIPDADAYRFAAAEVITTYFSQHYLISAQGVLIVYINATTLDRAASYHVDLQTYVASAMKIGERTVPVHGGLVLEERGGVLLNYSGTDRTKTVKEAVFAILSKGDALLFPASK